MYNFFVQGDFFWASLALLCLVLHVGLGAYMVLEIHRVYSEKCTKTKSKCQWFLLCGITSTDMELLTLWDWTYRPDHKEFDLDLFQQLRLPTQDVFRYVLCHTLFENFFQVLILLFYYMATEDALISPINICSLILSLCWFLLKANYWKKFLLAYPLREESQGWERRPIAKISAQEKRFVFSHYCICV